MHDITQTFNIETRVVLNGWTFTCGGRCDLFLELSARLFTSKLQYSSNPEITKRPRLKNKNDDLFSHVLHCSFPVPQRGKIKTVRHVIFSYSHVIFSYSHFICTCNHVIFSYSHVTCTCSHVIFSYSHFICTCSHVIFS